jgi:nucleoside-diphosphate-sugar epimerase
VRVLIAGCGYLGIALGARLSAEGHEVSGIRRSATAAPLLVAAGIRPVIADFTRESELQSVTRRWDWVIHSGAPVEFSEAAYRSVYLEGARQLVTCLRVEPPRAFVFVSSTSVYGQTDGSLVTEESITEPNSPTARVLLETENVLRTAAREQGFPARILRAAGIYGPGRNRLEHRVQSLREGAGSERYVNMIHREDLVSALIAVLDRGRDGEVYNACDDEPVREVELEQWLREQAGVGAACAAIGIGAGRSERSRSNKRVSAGKLRRDLGWRPGFPSFREGYTALLREGREGGE